MDLRTIFLLLSAIFINLTIQQSCDSSRCGQFCQSFNLTGHCDKSDRCECELGQTCSTIGPTCDIACKAFKMDGECNDQDQCICSATPELCLSTECQESCQKDPQNAACHPVVAVGCVTYGPVRFCSCVCYLWNV